MLTIVHGAISDRAEIWIATVKRAAPPDRVRMELWLNGLQTEREIVVQWQQVPDQTSPIFVARTFWEDLPASSRARVRTRLALPDSEWGPPASFRTLPSELPAQGDGAGPLIVGLSSCFYHQRASSGQVGQVPRQLPASRMPHFKILGGDQVYLDLPVQDSHPEDDAALAWKLALNYWHTWTQGLHSSGAGFSGYLAWGSNWFLSDDHEFWNNYPYATPIARRTWTMAGRNSWATAAWTLFDAFQRAPQPDGRTVLRVSVGARGTAGALEFAAIDGRYWRTRETSHRPSDLDEICDWLASLKGPGVLALSQPIFEAQAGFWGQRGQDAGIVDQDDFARLVRALDAAPHDVLLLSGDIHRGRTALARGDSSKSRIWEVVSSPTSICQMDTHKHTPAHHRFPPGPLAGVAPRTVETRVQVAMDNVATLAFERMGASVRVVVEFWAPESSRGPIATDTFLLR